MTLPTLRRQWILPLLIALLLGGLSAVSARPAAANEAHLPMVTAWAADDCTHVVNPGEDIHSVLTTAGTGDVVCVRAGTYLITDTIRMGASNPGRTLIGYPGEARPVLDGQKRYPGNEFAPLIRVEADDTVVEGLELINSTGRGIQVEFPAKNVTLRNLDVHDNWQVGILAKGNTNTNGDGITVNYVENVLIEDSRVYDNVRKAQYGPVIYKAHRTGSGPTDWAFIPEETWDAPYWDGTNTGFADRTLTGISVKFGANESPELVFATTGGSKTNYIDPENSATGAQIAYDGEDIVVYNSATGKWSKYFDGDALGLPTNVSIDAFNVGDAIVGCADCYPILFSLSKAADVPGAGSVTEGTIVRFTPTTSPDANLQLTTGTFSVAHAPGAIGLASDDNVDAIGHTPDGRLVISTSSTFRQGGSTLGANQDLLVYDASSGQWSPYFDASAIPFNPLSNAILASWLDDSGDLYVSGSSSGGNGLTFIEARGSTARNNEIFGNYGEGLVAGRNTDTITLEDNVSWDNKHANIYLNSTNAPLVQRNLVYCSTDKRFWRKASNETAKAGPGLIVRDEQFNGRLTIVSSNQTIINNIVVGCGINFGVYSQVDGGGLKDALVANNTFAEAQGDPGSGFQNFLLNSGADIVNTAFVNNVLLQTTGEVLRLQGAVNLSTASARNNLYSKAPTTTWFSGEAGRIIGDPLLVNPVVPAPNTPADPTNYGPQASSSVRDAGAALSEVVDDHLQTVRDGSTDIGAIEFVGVDDPRGQIALIALANPSDTGEQFDFTTSYMGAVQLGHNAESRSGSIATGSYSITPGAKAGWTVTDQSCSDGSSLDNIDLGAGETVICQVTYTLSRGEIEVRVATTPGGAAASFPFSTDYGDNFSLTDGQSNQSGPMMPDVYSVTLTSVPAGWTETAASCDDGSSPGDIELSAGETVICTFSFAQEPGKIVVVKETDTNSDDRFTFTPSYGAAFTLAGGESSDSGPLSPGSYAVAESAAAGWSLDSATCSDGSSPSAINVGAGETVTCTFFNVRDVAPPPHRAAPRST